jgi:hypothetical protein
MKIPSFKPTTSDIVSNEVVSSNKVIDSSDTLSFKNIPATATSSKVDNTSRRKLLTGGAVVAAGAVLPAGIGALGLLSASNAEAAGFFCPNDIPLPPGTVYYQTVPTRNDYDDSNTPKPCWSAVSFIKTRVFGVQTTNFRAKDANNLILHTWTGDLTQTYLSSSKTLTKYDNRTAAKVYNNGKKWWVEIFNYDKSNVPVMSFTKDLILNPITTDESFSIPDDDGFRKRSLTDRPNGQSDITRQEARNRMDAQIRDMFVNWFNRLQDQGRWVNTPPWHRHDDGPWMTSRPPFQPNRHNSESITINWGRSTVAQTYGNEPTPYFDMYIEMNQDPNHPNDIYRGNGRTVYRMVIFRDYDFPRALQYRAVVMLDNGLPGMTSNEDAFNFIAGLRTPGNIDVRTLLRELSDSSSTFVALGPYSDVETGAYINGFSLSNSNRLAVDADQRLLQAPLAMAFGAMGVVDTLGSIIPNNWIPGGVLQHILGFSLLDIPERFRAIREAFNRIVNNFNYPNILFNLADQDQNHRRLVGYTHDLRKKSSSPPSTDGSCRNCSGNPLPNQDAP